MESTVGQYKVLERLGSGALGDVFRARDTRAGRTVALMVPAPELIASPARRGRFLDDARRAAKLNHPNIAMLFDVIEQDETCYLAYEFAAGPSLREEMDAARLQLGEALRLAAHIADALAEGHANGVVHGDLRPDTIVVTPKGSPKVLNFGMTAWTSGGVARVNGAPAAAPDRDSDLFALGVVLYEMLTGRQPMASDTSGTPSASPLRQTPIPPSALSPGVPAEVDRIVMKLFAQTADSRYQTATAVAADIRRAGLDADAGVEQRAREGPAPERKRRGGATWLVLLALLALVAAVLGYLLS